MITALGPLRVKQVVVRALTGDRHQQTHESYGGKKRINYAVQLSPKDFLLSFNPGKIYFLFLSIFIIKKDLF